jgi:predicted lipoprotein with Yx(FWY)xxD motif
MKNATLAYCLLLLLMIAACSKDDNPSGPPAVENNVLLSSNASFGNILTDSVGKTLYFFSIDADGNSGCSGNCVASWPVFYKDNLRLASGLDSSDFGTITRGDGQKQTTYKGWPLYYFAGDAKAGDVNGDKVGGVWFVAKPDYTFMLAKKQLVGKDGVNYDSTSQPGTSLTAYITDDRGRTLYAFTPDSFNVNKWTKPDFSNNGFWPIFEGTTVQNVPSVLSKDDFTTINVYGKTQYTYKGWPMYYFGSDSLVRGKTLGVSVPVPGIWPVFLQSSAEAPKP